MDRALSISCCYTSPTGQVHVCLQLVVQKYLTVLSPVIRDLRVSGMPQVFDVRLPPPGTEQTDGELKLLLGNQIAGIFKAPAYPEGSWVEKPMIINRIKSQVGNKIVLANRCTTFLVQREAPQS